MALPDVVSHEQWLRARTELLAREKELTRLRDRLVADRRRLPMEKVEKDYRFTGPDGELTLEQLFEGRTQLIVGHFMFDPAWEDGCSSCTAGADEMSAGHLEHLHARDTTLAYVSRAPYEKLARYKAKRGWTFPWYSSYGSDVQLRLRGHARRVGDAADLQLQGRRRDPRDGVRSGGRVPRPQLVPAHRDGIFHTYSVFARGTETIGGSYYLLDETALGRQEEWEEPKGRVESARAAMPDFAT